MTREQWFALAFVFWLSMAVAMFWWLKGGGNVATVLSLVFAGAGFGSYMAGENTEQPLS